MNPALGWKIFFTRPLAIAFIVIAIVASAWMIRSNIKSQKKTSAQTTNEK